MLSLGFSTAISTQGFSWHDSKAVEGFKWIELALGYCKDNSKETFEKNLQQLRKDYEEAKKIGLKVWSIHLPYGKGMDLTEDISQQDIVFRNLKQYVDATIDMQPSCYVAHAHGRSENVLPEARATLLENANQNVKILARYIAEKGSILAIEGLPRTCIGNTAEECLKIIQDTSASICFDVNHMMHDTHQNFVSCLGNKIATVHLSDYELADEKHWVPGDGKIDWKEIMNLLDDSNYRGPMMFEVKYRKDGKIPTLQDVKTGFYNSIE